MIGVVERDRNIRIAERLAVLRSCENNILHGRTSKLLRALFSEHPAHRIRDVTLTASVWSDNTGDSVVKFKHDFVGKGLKSMYL